MSPDTNITLGGKELDPVRGGLLMIVVGIAVAGFGVYDYTQQSDAISNAVTVNATITETSVESVPQRRGGPDYRPEVTFDYRYEGNSYTSSNLYPTSFSSNYDTESAAQSAIEGYEAGDTVTAYVNPDSPGSAFLKQKKSNGPLKIAAIGGLLVLIGGVSVLRGS
ncbi:DUF3592 domain-containing protein [Halorussus aquaticus]|uniref:DUF3592 domain-containing protein n=1 Tax=Halorussus aquaticus TaxID=2953748 RepID=A0ABD5Q3Q6_9EURY|nr:DUF3592 domain-containing protein [Halorussus aquaticus]